jgi:hypothetical protein
MLQSQQPICLTRETRRVPEQYVQWPKKPRILFVAASPPGVGSIPVESHLLALRKAVDPWVKHWDSDVKRINEHLVFLPDASVESIQSATAEGDFTFVHILAHGVQYMEGYDVRYGLALHDARNPNGPPDIVTGERLATILRAAQRPVDERLARPIAVTLASCHSGNVGTVVGMGASIAHALHEAGIPIVVGGQFPISFAGSVLMVEALYEGLLWGDDLRISLNDLRRKLHSQYPATHDWASLVAYVSLPPQFEQWLTDIEIEQAIRGIDVAMAVADEFRWKVRGRRDMAAEKQSEELALFERVRAKIDAVLGRLEALLQRADSPKARIYGLLASTEKRRAEVYVSFGEIREEVADLTNPEYAHGFYQSLCNAQRYYWEAFQANRYESWGVVQYLSLDVVMKKLRWSLLEKKGLNVRLVPEERNSPDALWSMAKVSSLYDLRTGDEQCRKWALTNLIELYLLGPLIEQVVKEHPANDLANRALRYAEDFVNLASNNSFEVYSTRRQILRYTTWFNQIADIDPILDLAKKLLEKLPASERTDWTD